MSAREEDQDPNKKPSLFQVIISTLAAAFGVQSSKNRERDFKHGSIAAYIISGVLFTAIFILIIVFVVRLVLSQAGQ
ncbi:DUF2970 domain-containing protein [Marinimicrobium sp. C6131]|uniref:DUF2970 domain-containing protein n=1 Tax=Marinimicrobium sp. C6131 TaxID=3022676 RepID=UPI00223E722B|nr:DUF2970 domain-containing protein [Marinimicrobium sp. C6131]UZJ45681.1 DUF2970 domain-containing protein [Marinimicrobium sp. C6131]